MLEPDRNCWRIERANRAALVVDAADYFRHAREAMLRAESQILLVGWDFDTRIFLDPDPTDDAPAELGPLVSWLAKRRPGLCIHILRWDWGAVKLLGRGTTALRLLQWAFSKRVTFKLDSAHPVGASHHQKIIVIDDALAFCGGIDMTATRWDTRGHLDSDSRRRRPTTGRPYQPWHDVSMAVDGGAAHALGVLSRERWITAGGKPLAAPEVKGDPWPKGLKPDFQDVEVGIARTRGAYRGQAAIREIETLYLDLIAGARRFIYAENQFFASRVVAEAIAKRLAEPDGPEFIVINPKIVEGWLEEEVMSSARAELLRFLQNADRFGRFRIYTPVTECGTNIYVHSKVTIVDDEVLRVGSANLNNRSLGLDSECDLLINTARETNRGCVRTIGDLRCNLIAEHLGVRSDEVARRFEAVGSLISTIETLAGDGRTLLPLSLDEPNFVETTLAESELLDPESAGEACERIARPGLLRGVPVASRLGGSVAATRKLALIGASLIASAWLLNWAWMRQRDRSGHSR